jgi:dTDP-4-amino-4,6-dideoxygalactose transaminase
LSRHLDAPNITLFTNGHLALESALAAFNLSGEVITTPFTFASTTHAIVRNGLEPVFCDINPDDYTMDTDKLESLITIRPLLLFPSMFTEIYVTLMRLRKLQRSIISKLFTMLLMLLG